MKKIPNDIGTEQQNLNGKEFDTNFDYASHQ